VTVRISLGVLWVIVAMGLFLTLSTPLGNRPPPCVAVGVRGGLEQLEHSWDAWRQHFVALSRELALTEVPRPRGEATERARGSCQGAAGPAQAGLPLTAPLPVKLEGPRFAAPSWLQGAATGECPPGEGSSLVLPGGQPPSPYYLHK